MIATKKEILALLTSMNISYTMTLLGDTIMVHNLKTQPSASADSLALLLWSQGWTNRVTTSVTRHTDSLEPLFVFIDVPEEV